MANEPQLDTNDAVKPIKQERIDEIMTAVRNLSDIVLANKKWEDHLHKALESIEKENYLEASEYLKAAHKSLNRNTKIVKQAVNLSEIW